MDLDAYRLFLTLVKTRSFARTAERCHLSQPTVSQRLHQMEEELGVALLVRGPRLDLTPAGTALLPHAQALIEAEARTLVALSPFSERIEGTVHVSASQTAGGYILPPALCAFALRHAAVTVSLAIGNSAEVEACVLAGEADFGVVESPESTGQLLHQRLHEDRLILVHAPDHPLGALPDPLTPDALAGHLIALREPGSGTRATVVSAWQKVGGPPLRALEMGSLAAIRQSALTGATATFVSRHVVFEDLALGRLVARPVVGFEPVRTMRLVRRRTQFASHAAALLHADVAVALASIDAEPPEA